MNKNNVLRKNRLTLIPLYAIIFMLNEIFRRTNKERCSRFALTLNQ
jgi:hypothetical protein